MTLAAGTRLGSYEILALLGTGGMGEVYRARDGVLQREVALKVLRQPIESDPEGARRLVREARAAAALNHPHIAVVHAVAEEEGCTFIAMELVGGADLGATIRQGRLRPDRVLELAVEVAEALGSAHQRGIVHRDLKPSNVMLSEQGHVKLIDFGLARARAWDPALDGDTRSRGDASSHLLAGTPSYMSPEQARGAEVDHRTDIWSFGALLYEMLTGHKAFARATGADTIGAILRDPAPRLPALGSEVEPSTLAALQSVVDRCLAKDPTARYLDAQELKGELEGARRLIAGGPSSSRRGSGDQALPAPGARRTVTALVVGLGADVRGLDPERRRRRSDRVFERLRPILEQHGALCDRLWDSRVLGLFGVPAANEDDALRAVRAAVEIEAVFGEEGWRAGIGIDTGEVLTGSPAAGQPLVSGEPVENAAELERALDPGGVALGEATRSLLHEAASLERLERSSSSPPAWRLVRLFPHGHAIKRRLETPLVGRELELAQIKQVWERALRERRGHLVTLFGPAGIGKSKLALELGASLKDTARVLTGHCLSYGQGITYWPIREMVEQGLEGRSPRELLGGGEGELAARCLETAIGAGTIGAIRDETFWAVRKMMEALAGGRPLVLVFEDIQWAEPTLLDLIEHLVEAVRSIPLLVVCLARPELLEVRPGWGGGKLNAVAILLPALSELESGALMRLLPSSSAVEPAVLSRISALASGNPLFLEQMLAMVAEQGGGGQIGLPPAIQALLSARLDRLGPDEREVLECASIEGEVFHLGGLIALGAVPSTTKGTAVLAGLSRKELVDPEPSRLPGEVAHRFRHALIRDAAYERLTREVRSGMHERLAGWLVQAGGARPAEFEDLVAYHLEQAYRCGAELDLPDARMTRLAAGARQHLVSAGHHAFRRGDIAGAAKLLDRARALDAAGAPDWLELAPDVGFGLFQAGELEGAERLLDDAVDRARALGLPGRELSAWLVRALVHLYNCPDRVDLEETRREAERQLPGLMQAGDDLSLTRAWTLLWHLYQCMRDASSLRQAAERGLEHARRGGSRLDEAWSLSLLGWSLADGPTPVDECAAICASLLGGLSQDPLGEVGISSFAAYVAAMGGHIEEARSLILRSRAGLRELGTGTLRSIIEVEVMSSRVEHLAGDAVAMERAAREAALHSEEMGDHWFQVIALIDVARALCDQGRAAEALSALEQSDRLPSPPDGEIQIKRPAVRALVLAGLGQLEAAHRAAVEAVALAEGTLFLGLHAEALSSLALVLRRQGRTSEASAATAAALSLLDRKGDLASARRAREPQEGPDGRSLP